MPRKPGRKDEKMSAVVAELPLACQDEAAAIEFIERRRWGGAPPACLRCGAACPYMMRDSKTGARNRRFLWRCRECKAQFTCRTGTVFEDSKLPMRHWCRAFWMSASNKEGLSALEFHRMTGCTAKTALFVLARVRFAMQPDDPPPTKLEGTIVADETFVGDKPPQPARAPREVAIEGARDRGSQAGRRRACQARSSANTKAIGELIRANVEIAKSSLMTDESVPYVTSGKDFQRHDTVSHGGQEYVRGTITTNEVESLDGLIKRALYRTWHSVSKRRLGLYVAEVAFSWNHRKVDDGARTEAIVRTTEGERLTRKQYLAAPEVR